MVTFASLLNRRCNIWRNQVTTTDDFNERQSNLTKVSSNVPTRREGSKATDNVPLTIGSGDQLRSQQVFFFNPDVELHFRDVIELLPGATPQPEDGFWEILAIDSLDTFSRVHHIEVEAHRIFV